MSPPSQMIAFSVNDFFFVDRLHLLQKAVIDLVVQNITVYFASAGHWNVYFSVKLSYTKSFCVLEFPCKQWQTTSSVSKLNREYSRAGLSDLTDHDCLALLMRTPSHKNKTKTRTLFCFHTLSFTQKTCKNTTLIAEVSAICIINSALKSIFIRCYVQLNKNKTHI